MSPDELEHLIQSDILGMIGALPNVFCWRANSGVAHSKDEKRWVRFNVPGTADIIGCAQQITVYNRRRYPGTFFALEVKAAVLGRQRKEQKIFERAVRRGGGLYLLCRDKDSVRAAFLSLGWMMP